MSCSGSHLGITINIKNTKFVKTYRVRIMVFNATFNNIVAVSDIGGGNRSTQRKPLSFLKEDTAVSSDKI
jgi:hypothetical protein